MKIMVCMDGSNVAKDALDLAKKRAKALDAEIYFRFHSTICDSGSAMPGCDGQIDHQQN